MLVIETNGHSPVRRATAAEVEHRIVQLHYKCVCDAVYHAGENPVIQTTGLQEHQEHQEPLLHHTLGRSRTVPDTGTFATPSAMAVRDQRRPQNTVQIIQEMSPNMVLPLVLEGEGRSDDAENQSSAIIGNEKGSWSGRGDRSQQTTGPSHEIICPVRKEHTPLTSGTTRAKSTRHFACPFLKRNPTKHWKTCSHGWEQIHRVKFVHPNSQNQYYRLSTFADKIHPSSREHLYRRHLLPKHKCSRCHSSFNNAADLESHVRLVTPCSLSEPQDTDGITPEQERRLRSKKRTRTEGDPDAVELERWTEIYKIIFPGAESPHEPIPSPCRYIFNIHPNYVEDNGKEVLVLTHPQTTTNTPAIPKQQPHP